MTDNDDDDVKDSNVKPSARDHTQRPKQRHHMKKI